MNSDVAAAAGADAVEAGQAVYTPLMLRGYDFIVYGINSRFFWRCPKSTLLSLYGEHVSPRHLDVGVGTGCLLDECELPEVPGRELTLMDLNPNSLATAARRVQRYRPRQIQQDVLVPWELPAESVDSISMCHLLHCLPGTLREKSEAFRHAATALTPSGVFFGATVLGLEADHNPLSRRMIERLNRRGVFCNRDDRLGDLDAGLERAFGSHEVWVQGVVALFVAREPRRPGA
jgi:SAM-dependent methyltransferase